MWTLYFRPVVSSFFFLFFPRLISAVAEWMWCGLDENLECMSECAARGLLEIQDAKMMQKNRHLYTITQLCRGESSQLRHVSTIGKKLVKQQYLLHMCPQYGKLRPTSGWYRSRSLGHPSKFQRVSHLGFVTAPMSLNRRQQNFADVWPSPELVHYTYIFGDSCSLLEFYEVQNSLCIQALRSPILAAVLHGTRAAAVSQILCHGTRNGITELSQRAPPIFDWVAITLGIGPHSSSNFYFAWYN